MDLNAFLNDEATGSWADEMDSFPTARQLPPTLPRRAHFFCSLWRAEPAGRTRRVAPPQQRLCEPQRCVFPRAETAAENEQVDSATVATTATARPALRSPSPTPRRTVPLWATSASTTLRWTSRISSLASTSVPRPFESPADTVQTTSIRLVMGMDNKPKGFGYVEFDSVDNLKAALAMSGRDVGGRTVRISVAEPPKGREGRADEDISWTRSGPLAPLPGRGGSSFGAGREGGGGFDRPREGGFGGGFGGAGGEIERDGERMGFGSKFVPSVDAPRRTGGFERAPMGTSSYDRAGVGAPSEDRGERAGFGSKFVAAPPMQERPPFGGDRRVSGGPGEGRSDEEKTWSRSGPLAPLPGRGGAFGAREGGGGFDRPRDGGFGDRICESRLTVEARLTFAAPAGTPESTAPRRRLELSAKSTSTETSPAASPASARPSPFGNARPIDNSEKQKEVEAKIAKSKAELATRTAPRSDAFARREPVVAREEPSKAPAETPVAVADVQEKVADLII